MKPKLIRIFIFTLILIPLAYQFNAEFRSRLGERIQALGLITITYSGQPFSAGPVFDISGFMPGDCVTRSVDITNGEPSTQTLAVKAIPTYTDDNLESQLTVTISRAGTDLYGGSASDSAVLLSDFYDLSTTTGVVLPPIASTEATTFDFEVCFLTTAENEFQGTRAVFDLSFSKVQVPIKLPEVCSALQGQIFVQIDGTSGNDRIRGTGENELIFGYDGNDRIEGGGGHDCIIGGDGNDRIDGGTGNDIIDAGEGNDTVRYSTHNDIIWGRGGNDNLDGGSGDDLIYAGPGNDRVIGGSNNDYIEGGDGDDNIDAGSGNDLVYGQSGKDKIDGGADQDTLYGGDDDDNLNGGSGNDFLYGEAGNDTLKGGSGNDYLDGGPGDNNNIGNSGTDTCLNPASGSSCEN